MFTLIDGTRAVAVDAQAASGRVRLSPEALRTALGWEIHDGLLCNDATCVPVPPEAVLEHPDGVDLIELARVLDRPLAVDLEAGAALLGASAVERRRALHSLQAPDFTLPDLEGRMHSLAEQRGRKVLLVAYASW